MNDITNYDIIGDVHGRFDKLSSLMERMGYARDGDGFIPPAGHRALFLGDLIDPKPSYGMAGGVRSTLLAVKAMCATMATPYALWGFGVHLEWGNYSQLISINAR